MRTHIVWRILKWTAAIILIPVVLGLLAIAAINFFDEELSTDARALNAPPPAAAVTDANGYIDFLGFDAPPGEDARAWGVKVLDGLRASDSPGSNAGAPPAAAPLVAPKDVDWCNPALQSCLGPVADAARHLLQKHALALERYRAMRDKPEFVEIYVPARVESRIPSAGALLNAQRLSVLAIAAKAGAGEIDAALGELEKDFAFHRRAASGARTLIGKMIANRLLAIDVLLLSDLMRAQGQTLVPFRDRIAILLKPLSQDELTLSEALRNEYAPLVRLFLALHGATDFRTRVTGSGGRWWDALTQHGYRPNATANLAAERYRREQRVIEGPATGYEQAMAEARARTLKELETGIADIFVNPVGKLLHNISVGDYMSIAARMHDLNGLFRLVALQHALYAGGMDTPDAISAALTGALKSYADPYNGKPMAYDPGTKTLYFDPKGTASWTRDLKNRWQERVAIQL